MFPVNFVTKVSCILKVIWDGTYTQNRQIRENFLHAEFPVYSTGVHRFCPPPVTYGFYGDKVKYFHCKQYRFHILLTWEAIDSFNHRLGHVNALLYYNHTVPLKNPSQVRRVLPCSDSTAKMGDFDSGIGVGTGTGSKFYQFGTGVWQWTFQALWRVLTSPLKWTQTRESSLDPRVHGLASPSLQH